MNPAIEKIPDLKKRQRSIYWRPDGQGGWMKTQLLPSDSQGRELYFGKGFRLAPPAPTSDVASPDKVDTEKEELYAEIARLRSQIPKTRKKESLSGTL